MNNTSPFKVSKPVVFIIQVVTFFQIVLWISYFEAVTYATAYKSGVSILIFIIFSLILIALHILYFRSAKMKHKLILFGFWIIVIINIIFGSLCWYIASRPWHEFSDYEIDKIAKQLQSNSELDKGYTCLYRNAENNIFVIGKERTKLKKYFGIKKYLTFHNSDILLKIIPDDFIQYEQLIIPDQNDTIQSFINFFNWQFPDYLFFVVSFQKEEYHSRILVDIKKFIEASKYIDYVKPIFEEIIFGTLIDRLGSYWNLIKFTFGKSPLYRTDLVDDPYFLIWRGKINEAQSKLHILPIKRRLFIEKKLKKKATVLFPN